MHCHKLLLISLLLTAGSFICVEGAAADVGTTVAPVVDVTTTPKVPEVVTEDVEKRKTTSTTSTTTTTTTTTTPAPTTAATSTTTTSTTTTTTTPKPTTTTSAPTTTSTVAPIPTTTPKPKPYPQPKVGVWNSTCIKIQMAAQLNFTYITKDNKTATALYNIPDNAVVDYATCDPNATQAIQINWGPVDFQHSMTLHFSRDNKTVNLTILMFTLPLTPDDFPNAKENQIVQLLHVNPEFNVPIKMSYHCTRQQLLVLNETVGSPVAGTVAVQDLQLEAYRSGNATGFSEARDCDGSGTSDIVPIAVGVALVALIVIVLVAYLCARRRSTLRGYMSF